jgi:5-methyltetrahydrofolate--homocysteine methyltransferase
MVAHGQSGNRTDALLRLLRERIVVLDGAMGTMIQTYKLGEADYRGDRFKDWPRDVKGNNDLLSLTRPQVIEEIHRQYLEAGADIIETNTFNATTISMADYGMESLAYELNVAGAKNARAAAEAVMAAEPGRLCFVAGALGPTNKTASISGDVNNPAARGITYDQLVEAYYEQARGLLEGGADVLLVETVFDSLNSKAALFAIAKLFDKVPRVPVMLSFTITDLSGRTLSGQTVEAYWNSVSHFPLLSIGLNCALGPKEMRPFIGELSRLAPIYVSAYPNAGLPNPMLPTGFPETPETLAPQLADWASEGWLNIVGGCCGTTPGHIRLLAKAARKFKPRVPAKIEPWLRLSGLEPLTIRPEANFLNIGERTNITGSPKFAKLILAGQYEEALVVARQQVQNGAQIIDINMDEGMLDGVKAMTHFLNLVGSEPDIARVPVMIDSSRWPVIEAGLKCVQGKAVVNSISLKEGEEKFVQQAALIRRYGAAVVVMAFDEKGQADSYERRKEVCARCYKILTERVHFPPEDIVFDPNILTVATGLEEHNNYAVDFIAPRAGSRRTCRMPASAAASNISFSFRGNNLVREAMHSAFLYHAIRAGLDMGIVNAGQLAVYEEIPKDLLELVEDVLLNRRPDATERLVEFADTVKQKDKAGRGQGRGLAQGAGRGAPLPRAGQRHCRLHRGRHRGSAPKIGRSIRHRRAAHGGDERRRRSLRFGQNVPAAGGQERARDEKAVAYLMPLHGGRKNRGLKPQGRIVMATVKGDVHDIGKNIVGVVLQCNNYEVIDLGVMVSTEKILETARERKADVIGLSGLITPSLDEMVHVAREMDRLDFPRPAAHRRRHHQPRPHRGQDRPALPQPVVHVLDASRAVGVVGSLPATN